MLTIVLKKVKEIALFQGEEKVPGGAAVVFGQSWSPWGADGRAKGDRQLPQTQPGLGTVAVTLSFQTLKPDLLKAKQGAKRFSSNSRAHDVVVCAFCPDVVRLA